MGVKDVKGSYSCACAGGVLWTDHMLAQVTGGVSEYGWSATSTVLFAGCRCRSQWYQLQLVVALARYSMELPRE